MLDVILASIPVSWWILTTDSNVFHFSSLANRTSWLGHG